MRKSVVVAFVGVMVVATGYAAGGLRPAGAGYKITPVEFRAPVHESGLPSWSVAASIDSKGRVHIAWIRRGGDSPEVMHSVVSPDGTNKTTAVTDTPFIEVYPSIALDDSDGVHMSYFLKRDGKVEFFPSGNFAVSYAHGVPGADGAYAFTTEQVSTNPLEPKRKDENIWNAFVSGRPMVSILPGGRVGVYYETQASDASKHQRFIALASKQIGAPGAWAIEPVLRTDDSPTFDTARGICVAERAGEGLEGAYIDISNYDIRTVARTPAGWLRAVEKGFTGSSANRDAHLFRDKSGKVWVEWFNRTSDSFCRAPVEGGKIGVVVKAPVARQKKVDGNYQPAALDASEGKWFYLYKSGSQGDAYLMDFDGADVARETKIEGIGKVMGSQALCARDGRLAAVGVVQYGDGIRVTFLEKP